MKTYLILTSILFAAFCSYCFSADRGSTAFQIRDSNTGKSANLKLHDNHDGTVSMIVMAVIVTPTPTSTSTVTPTATVTPTPTTP